MTSAPGTPAPFCRSSHEALRTQSSNIRYGDADTVGGELIGGLEETVTFNPQGGVIAFETMEVEYPFE